MKPGQTLYMIGAEDDGKPTVEIWIIRTIRGGKITAIWKLSYTWGKRSRKNGDFGWIDPIPAWCRKTWPITGFGSGTGTGPYSWSLFTTKRAAIQHALKNTTTDDFETQAEFDRHIAGLKRMRP